MDGDNVSDIDATTESQQVALIVKSTYLEMMANRNWPHMHTLFSLQGSGDSSLPNVLRIPDNIKEIKWVKYNKRKSTDTRDKFEQVKYMHPVDFLEHVQSRNSSNSSITSVKLQGVGNPILTFNDRAPEYWTSFDDVKIVMDNYDSAIDGTLREGKNSCWGVKSASWSHDGASTPDLPEEAFPALVAEAKSTAFYSLRQTENEKAEQKSRRQQRWLSRKAWKSKGGVRYPDYGRKGGGRKNRLFDKG